jgi:hypothetical protein
MHFLLLKGREKNVLTNWASDSFWKEILLDQGTCDKIHVKGLYTRTIAHFYQQIVATQRQKRKDIHIRIDLIII